MSGNYSFVKKLNIAAFIVMWMLFALPNAAAQENTFEPEDLQALIKAASQKLEGKTYRSNMFYVFYVNGNSANTSTITVITEVVSPDRKYVTEARKDETGKTYHRFEIICIGDKRFSRRDNGEWKKDGAYCDGGGWVIGAWRGSEDGVETETITERRLKKGEITNNQTTDLYEMITTVKYIYPTKTYTNIYKDSIWFNANGMFVKIFREVQSGDTKNLDRDTTEYEYDPKDIKPIEAPIK